MLRKLCLSLLLTTVSLASAQNTRHFTFHYGFTVKSVPAGERVRVWFPAAQSDEFQEVKTISANGDLKLKKTHESRFGNEMYYAESSKAQAPELHFELIRKLDQFRADFHNGTGRGGQPKTGRQ